MSGLGKAFCPQCRTMREVADEYQTDTGDRLPGQPVTYVARPLVCGHETAPSPSPRPAPPADPTLVDRVAELQRRNLP